MFLLSLPPTTDTPEPPRLYAHAQCVLSSPLACWKCVQAIRACVSQQVLLFFFSCKRRNSSRRRRTTHVIRVTNHKQKSVVLQNHAITRRLTPKGGRKENRCKLALCSKPKSTTRSKLCRRHDESDPLSISIRKKPKDQSPNHPPLWTKKTNIMRRL